MALTAAAKKILTLSLLCALYWALGTVIFVAIENSGIDETASEKRAMERWRLKNNTMKKYNMSSQEYNVLYEGILSTDDTASEWNYWGGFSFVIQVVTTIGYGTLTPSTTAGRVLCIFYALFGIPLCVLFLQTIGEELLRHQRKLLIKLELCVRGGQGEPRYLNEKCVASSFALIVIIIFIGAGIQVHLEQWSFLEGVYCYFITYTTIGFGDFVPGGGGYNVMYVIRPFSVLFGLAVMANIVNALVGCVDTMQAFKRLFRCHPLRDTNCEVEARQEEKIAMKDRSAGNEEA